MTEPVADSQAGRDLVFVSYSRDDAEWVQVFQDLLEPLLDGLGMRVWVDARIRTGDDWSSEIDGAIARSAVALLLVSASFLDSDYIRNDELPALLAHRVRLAPILIGPCPYEAEQELTRVQWLHDPRRDGPLSAVEHERERVRRISQACRKLALLLPRRTPTIEPALGPPIPRTSPPGESDTMADSAILPGVPSLPPGYVPRAELTGIVEAVVTGSDGVVGLYGQAGVGKSVLAGAAARDKTVNERFPDGVRWITVGKSGDVVRAQLDLLRMLDPVVPLPSSAAGLERALRVALQNREVLLVVDDVWSDAAAQLFQLTDTRSRILYTTRDPRILDAVGARAVPVGALDPAAALALAAGVLRADEPDSPPSAAELPAAADRALAQVGRVALAVSLLAAAVRGGRSWTSVDVELTRDVDVFGDHPYANTFKAMQVAVATLPAELAQALYRLAVFAPDRRSPVAAVARYWFHTRGFTAVATEADVTRLFRANVLTLDAEHIAFHPVQYDYLLLNAPAVPGLHAQLLDAYRGLLVERDQWWQLPLDEPYLRDQLVAHLRGAGARRELAQTVTDPAFVAQRVAAGGVLLAERDLEDAAATLPDDDVISWWRSWLPHHAHVLGVPGVLTGLAKRSRALVPTLRAWVGADPTRPAEVDSERLLPLVTRPHLEGVWGFDSPSSAELRVITGHSGAVCAVAWSPDGTRLATGGFDHTARIWDADSGTQLMALAGHGADISAVAWCPDGTRLATTSDDGLVRIWDLATGETNALLRGHSNPVRGTAWSTDGSRLATTDADQTRIWDVVTCVTLVGVPGQASSVAWSPDDRRIVTAGVDPSVRIWDAVTGRLLDTLTGHTDMVDAVAWSPDGGRLATGSGDRSVRIWDLDAGGAVRVLAGHTDRVTAVTWSPDGSGLVSASFDGTARMWDVEANTTVRCDRHAMWVFGVAWSPDGTRFATAGADATVRVWSIVPDHDAADHDGRMLGIAWSPDGSRLASAGERGVVRLWDPGTGRITSTFDEHTAFVDVVVWSPDSTRLATASGDRTARIWEVDTGRTSVLANHPDRVRAVAWSPDGSRLATTSSDAVRIWNPGNDEVTLLTGLTDLVRTVAWSPDGTLLAAGDFDGNIRLWDTVTGQTIATLLSGANGVDAMTWAPPDSPLTTFHHDGTVQIWDPGAPKKRSWRRLRPSTLRPTARLPPHEPRTADSNRRSFAWSPEGTRLAIGENDGAIRFWDPQTDQTATLLRGGVRVQSLSFSPDGTRLATLRSHNEIIVYSPYSAAWPARMRLEFGYTDVAWEGPYIAVLGLAGVTMLRWVDELPAEATASHQTTAGTSTRSL